MIHVKGSLCNKFCALVAITQYFEEKIMKITIERANSESLAVFKGGSMNRSKLSNQISRAFLRN
jgi:hypothetical protein